MTQEQLLPQEVLQRLPPLYATEASEEKVAQVKFFYPDAAWTWYAVEFDGDDLFFGLFDGFEKELGYFRLSALLATHGRFGCPIERDMYFAPTPVRKLMA
jgi:hypothetical protein